MRKCPSNPTLFRSSAAASRRFRVLQMIHQCPLSLETGTWSRRQMTESNPNRRRSPVLPEPPEDIQLASLKCAEADLVQVALTFAPMTRVHSRSPDTAI